MRGLEQTKRYIDESSELRAPELSDMSFVDGATPFGFPLHIMLPWWGT